MATRRPELQKADEDSDADSDDGGDDNGNSEAIDMGDLLGKAIAFVKQVIHLVAVLTCMIMCT